MFLYLIDTFAIEVHQAKTTLSHRISLKHTQFLKYYLVDDYDQ